MFSNKDLRSLIFPLVIEQVLSMLVGIIDTVMISYAGEAAISGVALVDMVVVGKDKKLVFCFRNGMEYEHKLADQSCKFPKLHAQHLS